jgi:drug/metabolite transporter (DMT)-like permease
VQVFWTLLSSLMYATMSLMVKVAAEDFSLPTIVFFRALPGAIFMFAFARIRGLTFTTPHWKVHGIRSAVGITSLVLAFFAVSRLPLATATCLDYTAPIFMALYLVVILRHRPTLLEHLALAGGFAGVVVLLQPTFQQDDVWPFVAGLGGGALAAVSYMQIRRLARLREPLWRIVFVYSVTGLVASSIVIPFTPTHDHTLEGVLALGGVGLTGLVAQVAMTRAYSHGTPTVVATLQYSTVVFAALYGYFLWGDRPSVASASGLILVVVSGAIAAWQVRSGGSLAPRS